MAFGLFVAEVEGVAHGFESDVVAALEVLHGGAETSGARGDDGFEVLAVELCSVCGGGLVSIACMTTLSSCCALERLEEIVDGAAAEGAGDYVEVIDSTVSMTTGMAGWSVPMWSSRVRPSVPGIMMSERTRS